MRSHLVFRQRDTWNSTDVLKLVKKGRHVNHVLAVTATEGQLRNPILVLYAKDSSEIGAKPFEEITRRKRSLTSVETR